MPVKTLTLVLDMDSGGFSTKVTDSTGKLRQLNSVSGETVRKLDAASSSGKTFGAAMRDVHHSISTTHIVLLALTSTVGAFTVGLVKMNAETQRSLAMLEGLSRAGSQAARRMEAASDFKFLQEFSKTAPYSMEAITDAFVKLKSVGIDPANGSLKAMIDGVANFGGSNDVLKRAVIAIQQMAGKGVISMEELRQQLGEAMPTALRLMAQAAGKNVQDFVKEVSKGKVSVDGLIKNSDGTLGKFFVEAQKESAGASERLMDTFDGQVSRAKTGIRQLALAIGGFEDNGTFTRGGFMATLTNNAKDFGTWLSNPTTIGGARKFGNELALLLTEMVKFVSFVKSNVGTIQLLGTAFLAFKGTEFARAGINSLARMIGIAVEGNGRIASSAIAARLAQVQTAAETITGHRAVAGSAVDLAMQERLAADAAYVRSKAVMESTRLETLAIQEKMRTVGAEEALQVEASNVEVAATEARIAALKAEAAQHVRNIELAEAEIALARQGMAAALANNKAGFGNVRVGAGRESLPAQTRFKDADNNRILALQQLQQVEREIEAEEAARASARAARDAARAAETRAVTLAHRELAAAQVAEAEAANVAGSSYLRAAAAKRALGAATSQIAGVVRGFGAVLTGVVDLLGGPLIVGLMAAGGAFLYFQHRAAEAEKETADYTATMDALKKEADELRAKLPGGANGINNMGGAAADQAVHVGKFAGEVGKLADELFRLARANQAAGYSNALKQLAAAGERKQALEAAGSATGRFMAGLGRPFDADYRRAAGAEFQRGGIMSVFNPGRADMAGILEMEKARRGRLGVASADYQRAEAELRRWADPNMEKFLGSQDREQAKANVIANDMGKAGKGGGGKSKPYKATPQDRMENRVRDLESTKTGLEELIDTLDVGSLAAEKMKARLADMANLHQKITPAMAADAKRAAEQDARSEVAITAFKGIMGSTAEQAEALTDAMFDLGDGTDNVSTATDKFARKLEVQRKAIVAAGIDAGRLAKVDGMIAEAVSSFELTKLIEGANRFHEEVMQLSRENPNPNMRAWDAFSQKMVEVNKRIKDAREAADKPGLAGDKLKNAQDDRDRIIEQSERDRERYTKHYVETLKFSLEEETRANSEALMTQEQQRKLAHDREIARIMEMTDVSKLNEQERAMYGAQMARLRADAITASDAKMARDLETPSQKMVRDWSDTNEQLKQLQGEWMGDFFNTMKDANGSWSDFCLKVIQDYTMMLIKARMAKQVETAIDGIAGFLGKTIGSVLGAGFGGGGQSFSLASPTDIGMVQTPGSAPITVGGHHLGGIVGLEPTFLRNVSPDSFSWAPRYHGGGVAGFRPGEVPAVLKEGEGVFTPEQMKALGMGGSGSAPPVQVNMINNSGQDIEADHQGAHFDGRQWVIDIVMDAASKRGPMRDMLKGVR